MQHTKVLLSLLFLLTRHIHIIFTASVHKRIETQTIFSKLITIPSLSEWGRAGKGTIECTGLSAWHHCEHTPDMAVVCPL